MDSHESDGAKVSSTIIMSDRRSEGEIVATPDLSPASPEQSQAPHRFFDSRPIGLHGTPPAAPTVIMPYPTVQELSARLGARFGTGAGLEAVAPSQTDVSLAPSVSDLSATEGVLLAQQPQTAATRGKVSWDFWAGASLDAISLAPTVPVPAVPKLGTHSSTRSQAAAKGDRVETRRPGAVVISVIVFACIVAGFNLMWTRFITTPPAAGLFDQIQQYLFYFWLLALPQTLVNLQGALLTHPKAPRFILDSVMDALRTPLHIRIVTHGTNVDTVRKTVEVDYAVIDAFTERYGVRPKIIVEVVTDNPFPVDAPQYLVPRDFATPNGALFKARGLHFAVQAIPIAPYAWILHCDEETQLTFSGLLGCLQFIQREIETVAPGQFAALGQGTILYHRDFWKRPFMTLADSIRTAMDFGYFRVQYHVWHRPLLGVHGSFILVREDIERAVGFDFDAYRSITEDAYWALLLVERHIRLKWVHGFLSEQATFGILDFLRQRRRWFTGLWHVLSGRGVRWRTKLVLRLAVASWAFAFFGTFAIVLQLIHPVYVPWYIILLSSVSLATYSSITVYGLLVNLRELPLHTRRITWLIVLAQVSLMPIFGLMETTAIVWGLFTVNRVNFHVVKK